MWNQRNKILHTDDIYAVTSEHEMLNTTLNMFRKNLRVFLHYLQYNMVKYTGDQLQKWSIDTKTEVANILIAARFSYATMLKREDRKKS